MDISFKKKVHGDFFVKYIYAWRFIWFGVSKFCNNLHWNGIGSNGIGNRFE